MCDCAIHRRRLPRGPAGSSRRSTVPACLLATEFEPHGAFDVTVGHEHLTIPGRIYNPPPGDDAVSALREEQRLMLACLFTRHHNGYVRQQYAELVAVERQPWVVPYVVHLLGEYVVEIAEAIKDRLPRDQDSQALYARFAQDNPMFMATIHARATSYWNCYYRRAYPDRVTYPGLAVLAEITEWTRA